MKKAREIDHLDRKSVRCLKIFMTCQHLVTVDLSMEGVIPKLEKKNRLKCIFIAQFRTV